MPTEVETLIRTLSGTELIARLVNRGVAIETARSLVARRENDAMAVMMMATVLS